MISVNELLKELDSLIEDAVSVPFSGGKGIIDTAKALELIDDIVLHLPNEMQQARMIVAERSDIIADARKEAESITRRAEDRARAMVNKEEVVRRANIQADEMISSANAKSSEIRKRAISYAENIMSKTESIIAEQLEKLRQDRQSLRTASSDDAAAENPKGKGVLVDIDLDGNN